MKAYPLIEFFIVALIVGISADYMLRTLFSASYRRLCRSVMARLGLRVAAEPQPAGGCASGCGGCSTGCDRPTASTASPSAASREQPLKFHPR